jgi:tetratricopeptide (TPR) repeat protein
MGKVDHMQETVDEVQVFLRERLPTLPSSQPRIRASIPANGNIFHGRDSLVAQLVRILTSKSDGGKRPRVCLLGPGGMGKTSTALAVMADPEMKKHFPGQNQIWVPCVKATSLSLFLDTFYSSLGTTQKSGDTLKDIVAEINSSSDPLVLLLDNFETPWNVVESRSETERILYEIDRIPHVTLFITMRAFITPCNGDQWQSFPIEEVNEEAARQIYLDICPAGKGDTRLSVLLQSLGHMPLAITLMANLAKSFGWDAGELLEQYKRIGTSMIGQGRDANHSLDVCISLSVDSTPMKTHPEAYRLLATLAMLPVGTTYHALDKWWARDSPNLVGPLQVLTEASLVQRRGTHYFVLPVIRSYVLDPSRFPGDVRTAMIAAACNFLTHHNSSPGDPSFKEQSEALSKEEGNLQAILLQATDLEPKLIEAFLLLGQHQLLTRPRLEVIEHALKLARQMESHPKLVGDVLTCHGRILFNLDRYDQAIEQFSNARQTFLSIPNEQLAARSLLDLAEVHIFIGDSRFYEEAILSAQSVLEKLDDGQGVALSFYYLGIVFGQTDRRTEGIVSLTRAGEMFQKLQDLPNQAKCSYFLAHVYLWERRYEEGLRLGMAAVQEYENLGQYSGEPMLVLGKILFQKGSYPAALAMLVRTLAICKSYGRPIIVAQTLEMIGRTHAKMDKKADAQAAYEEAMQYHRASHTSMGEPGMIRCQFLIRQLENPFLEPTFQERSKLRGIHQDF